MFSLAMLLLAQSVNTNKIEYDNITISYNRYRIEQSRYFKYVSKIGACATPCPLYLFQQNEYTRLSVGIVFWKRAKSSRLGNIF